MTNSADIKTITRLIRPPRVSLRWDTEAEAAASVATMDFMLKAASGHADVYVRRDPTQSKGLVDDTLRTFHQADVEFAVTEPALAAGGRLVKVQPGKDVMIVKAEAIPPVGAADQSPPLTLPDATHIMLDLETYGRKRGCVVLSIGAVAFGPRGVSSEFKVNLAVGDQQSLGLVVDAETRQWWSEQPESAFAAATYDAKPTLTGLSAFVGWLTLVDSGMKRRRIWGNGADFDNDILAEVFERANMVVPWFFYNNRCFRTLKNLFKRVDKPAFVGEKHDALADARHQAEHAVRILNANNLWSTV